MEFGICTQPRAVAAEGDSISVALGKLKNFLRDSGADFVEFGVGETRPEDDGAFRALKNAVEEHALPLQSFNCFLPAHHRVTGEDVNLNRVLDYARVALNRCAALGGEIVVLGSGGARRVPDGFSPEKARDQFIEFCRALAPLAQENDITIVIEPLNAREDNLVNTVEQGALLVDEIAHPQIQLLADQYHMDENGESYAAVATLSTRLRHVHTADLGRSAPGFAPTGETDFVGFFRALRSSGYANRPDARIAIECNWSNLCEEAAPALKLLRERWDESDLSKGAA